MTVKGKGAHHLRIWFNVRDMKHPLFLLLLPAIAVGVWAQSSDGRNSVLDNRRAELRSALKAMREQAASDQEKTANKAAQDPLKPVERRLSAQERSDLRQQLRQQRQDPRE